MLESRDAKEAEDWQTGGREGAKEEYKMKKNRVAKCFRSSAQTSMSDNSLIYCSTNEFVGDSILSRLVKI